MLNHSALDPFAQSVIAQLPVTFVGRYSALCAAVLLFYDYFLTFPLEWQHIWQGKMNATKILFFLNRYFSLILCYGEVLLLLINKETNSVCSSIFLLEIFQICRQECRTFYYIEEISGVFTAFAISSIFTLRTYAIYGRSRTVLFLLAVPTIVGWSSGIWVLAVQIVTALPRRLQFGPLTCSFYHPSSFNAGFVSTGLANYASGAVFDALVMVLTVCRTGNLALQSRKATGGCSLSYVFVRDGIFYYSALFVPKFAIVVLYMIGLKRSSDDLNDVTSSLSYISTTLEIVMTNRLVLNLSHTVNVREDSEFRIRTGLEPLTFASGTVLGNIGGYVRTIPDNWDDEMPDLVDDESVDVEKAKSNRNGVTNVKENGGFRSDDPRDGDFKIE